MTLAISYYGSFSRPVTRFCRVRRARLWRYEWSGLTTRNRQAFLLPEATIAQRIVAQTTLSESGLAYQTPRGEELSERLASVLEVVTSFSTKATLRRAARTGCAPNSAIETLRMGRVLTSIAPHEPEVHGLLALMELNVSRTAARTDAAGEPMFTAGPKS